MKYIITTVQEGASLNKNMWSNVLAFQKKHNVDKILVFILNGKNVEEVIHKDVAVLPVEFIDGEHKLNEKVKAYHTKVLAQNVDPLLGQANKLPSEYSYVMPGTKVRYFSAPNIGVKARFYCSTGCITNPNYVTKFVSSGLSSAKGLKAKEQHTYGFVYFQDEGGGKFDIYQVSADKSGNFYYLNEKYRNGKVTTGRYLEALTLGDWHTGDTNPEIREKTINMIDTLKPRRVVFHDLFDGYSINHHQKGNLLQELRTLSYSKDLLEDELREVAREIEFFSKRYPDVKFIVPESNHDIFIKTYLDKKLHHVEPHNYLQAIKIIPRVININSIVLKEALLTVMEEIPRNFIFLRENDPYRIGGKIKGVAIGQHGHKGINGAKGTPSQFRRTNIKQITGHTHSPMLYENGMVVGTSTYLEVDYNIGGLSSWMNAHGVLYPNMTYSLVTLVAKQLKRKSS